LECFFAVVLAVAIVALVLVLSIFSLEVLGEALRRRDSESARAGRLESATLKMLFFSFFTYITAWYHCTGLGTLTETSR
jgi:hypothetical protein